MTGAEAAIGGRQQCRGALAGPVGSGSGARGDRARGQMTENLFGLRFPDLLLPAGRWCARSAPSIRFGGRTLKRSSARTTAAVLVIQPDDPRLASWPPAISLAEMVAACRRHSDSADPFSGSRGAGRHQDSWDFLRDHGPGEREDRERSGGVQRKSASGRAGVRVLVGRKGCWTISRSTPWPPPWREPADPGRLSATLELYQDADTARGASSRSCNCSPHLRRNLRNRAERLAPQVAAAATVASAAPAEAVTHLCGVPACDHELSRPGGLSFNRPREMPSSSCGNSEAVPGPSWPGWGETG